MFIKKKKGYCIREHEIGEEVACSMHRDVFSMRFSHDGRKRDIGFA